MQAMVSRIRFDYATTGVTTATSVEIVSALTGGATGMSIFDSSGRVMALGMGASGTSTEKEFQIITPGGNDGIVPCRLGDQQRLTVRALDVCATAGQLVICFYR